MNKEEVVPFFVLRKEVMLGYFKTDFIGVFPLSDVLVVPSWRQMLPTFIYILSPFPSLVCEKCPNSPCCLHFLL